MDAVHTLCFALPILVGPAFALSGQQIENDLQTFLSPEASFYLPSDPNYKMETTQRWTTYSEPSYVISVKPSTEQDVQSIIQFAFQNNISFLGTGGGHGYTTTLGSVQNGIEMDLGHFNEVSIDGAASTMTVGGSVTFANLTDAIYAAGKEFQVGSCSCVGILGATLGGGIGPYGSLHGLITDALLSVRMVTGAGELLDVSATQNPDLFWGLRGAGQNFGVITQATYALADFTNGGQAMNADFIFPGSANGSLWEIARSFGSEQPDQLAMDFGIAYNASIGGAYMLVNVIYVGPLAQGMEIIQPFLALPILRQNITMLPWKALEKAARFGTDAESCIKGQPDSVYSLNLYNIDVPTLTDVFNYIGETLDAQPGLRSTLLAFDKYASRVTRSVPDAETAYPWRDTEAYVHLDIPIANSSLSAAAATLGETTRSKLAATSGSSSYEGGPPGNNNSSDIQVYVNYARGDEGPVSWYSERKLPRLMELKSRYDPSGLFSHYNGL